KQLSSSLLIKKNEKYELYGKTGTGIVNGKYNNEIFEALNAFVTELNNDVRQFLNKYYGVYINSSTSGSPFVLNISFPGEKGEVIGTTETEENGKYRFYNLDSGKYKVIFEKPAGLTQTGTNTTEDD
ncbi:SdrD B-like domain-containing protein, partial [Staphylococcus aureus]|uniref:SdrD B-like domain-containing protein n=1 Tax=Staphylococcus aureus TaxID=1280 RepID=UPI00272E9592